ncbi:MAG TPA: thiamine phosphate synthase [Candidatus Limnocylindria bacterium]|nr:thiamine phosphate synthase [Candidatus Limnocylindria bacterium]
MATGPDRRVRLADARLYLCTDARRRQGDLAAVLDAVLAGGVDIIQLRDKRIEARQEIECAEQFADAARRHGALFAINDRTDIARAVHPDVLHLGQDDLPVAVARDILGDDILIGRSTHAEAEVAAAAAQPGVDYFCVGPTWPTPTKPGRPAPGLPLLRYAASLPGDVPWFAIGGVGLGTLDEVVAAGAKRAVVVRAITEADDPGAAAAAIAARLRA